MKLVDFFSLGLKTPDISFAAFISEIRTDPLALFQFLIPLLVLVFAVLTLKIRGTRVKVNSNPSMVQERENFELPDNDFNREMIYVTKQDFDHFEVSIEERSRMILASVKILDRMARKYKRLKYKAQYTTNNARKKRLNTLIQSKMGEMLKLYNTVEKEMLKLNIEKLGDE